MKNWLPSLAILVALGAACPADAQAQKPAPAAEPAAQDWTQIVSATPEGGFRMGNPDAAVKLVEYASITCPHCAAFSKAASGPLTQLVRKGRVSWEKRHFLLFPPDPGASLLAACHGPDSFFAVTKQLYADQPNWSGRLQSLPGAELERIEALPVDQQVSAVVKAAGLDQFFRERGMAQSRIDACLADRQALEALAATTKRATEEGVTGTPSFFINGSIAEGATGWTTLEPAIRSALRR